MLTIGGERTGKNSAFGEQVAANQRGTSAIRPRQQSFVQLSKGSPYSIVKRWVPEPELIPVVGSQPAGDVSHKPGGRLPLLSARPAVTFATLKRAATIFAAW